MLPSFSYYIPSGFFLQCLNKALPFRIFFISYNIYFSGCKLSDALEVLDCSSSNNYKLLKSTTKLAEIMEHIKDIVQEYITTRSNYALLLTGKWGIGKTYFYHNELVEVIEDTFIPDKDNPLQDSPNRYKSIYISLFGLQSIEDVQEAIFFSLYSKLLGENAPKIGKLLMPLLKGVTKKISSIDLSKSLDLLKQNTTNYEQLVLCFDDWERKHPKLSTEELAGFINHLAQHYKAKTILIANESEIKEKDSYATLKEKIIGNTIPFVPSWEEQAIALLKYRFENCDEFIEAVREDVLRLSKDECDDNLRTLGFALMKLHKVWSELNLDKYKDLNQDIKQKACQFTILSSIWYKKGLIDYSHRRELEEFWSRSTSNQMVMENINSLFNKLEPTNQFAVSKEQPTNIQKFAASFERDDYENKSIFFVSIFSYTTGANSLDSKLLLQEIEVLSPDNSSPVALMRQLQDTPLSNFTDEQYKQLHEDILEYADEGDYPLSSYPTIFVQVMRCGERLFGYEAQELVNRLKEGMKRSKQFEFPLDQVSFGHLAGHNKKSKHFKEREALEEYSNELKEELDKAAQEQAIQDFYQDFEQTWEEKIKQLEEKYKDTPILDPNFAITIYDTLFNSLDFCEQFSSIMYSRYYKINPSLKKELTFLQALSKKLQPTTQSRQENTIKNIVLDRLLEQVKLSIKRISKE